MTVLAQRPGGGFQIIDGGFAGPGPSGPSPTLNVKVFRDDNGNGKFDGTEEFLNFKNSSAEVKVGDSTITLDGQGYYTNSAITSGNYNLGINPDEENNWQVTGCDFSNGCSCNFTPTIAPGSTSDCNGTFCETNYIGLAPGETETVYLGIKHLSCPDVPTPAKPDPTPNGFRSGAVTGIDLLAANTYKEAFATGVCGDNPNSPVNGVDYDCDKGVDLTIPPDGIAEIIPNPADPKPAGLDYDVYPEGDPDGVIDQRDLDLINARQIIHQKCYSPGEGTLWIRVFNDLNKNGVLDPGEAFGLAESQFNNLVASAIALDGNPISILPDSGGFDTSGFYSAYISATPDHTLAIDPNETNGVQITDCSFSDDTPCSFSSPVGNFYVTDPFRVDEGKKITVFLGVKQNHPPDVDLGDPLESEECHLPNPYFHFSWHIEDTESDKITWEFQIDTPSDHWNNPIKTITSSGLISTPADIEQMVFVEGTVLLFDKNYEWRVRATDEKLADSDWQEGNFHTPKGPPPDPSFQCSRETGVWTSDCFNLPVTIGDSIDFKNPNLDYGNYEWDINNDGIFEENGQEIDGIKFFNLGRWTVHHQVTDDGITCSSTQILNIRQLNPTWIEVSP